MKVSFALLALSSSSALVSSFPGLDASNFNNLTSDVLNEVTKTMENLTNDIFFNTDPNKPVDITGKHIFRAPTKTDQRGPCPGLNALANHAYISRDGITSLAEVVTAINRGSYQIPG
jgi:hypothetical protein